ncbi:Putative receptor-like protein kinase At1g80870 [Linum perenne]
MKLEKKNMIRWCRKLAHGSGDIYILEIVDDRLNEEDYNNEEASLYIHLVLICLQKMSKLRSDISDIAWMLKGEMEIPQLPFVFLPSPPASRRKHRGDNNIASTMWCTV